MAFSKHTRLGVKVGVPHIKRRIFEIRNSSYDIYIALLDIIDNVEKGYRTYIDYTHDREYINTIYIRDNDINGFKNITENDCKNPLNMGHENNERHYNDDSNSEYGVGLKHASIFLANRLDIYTRVENKYYHALLDFGSSSNK